MKEVIGKIILAVLVLAILLGIGIYIYSESDFFKNDKQLFYKYAIDKNIDAISKINIKPYEKLIKTDEKGYEFSGEFKFDTLNNELDLENDVMLKVNSNSDTKTNKSSASYVVKFGEENLLEVNYLRNDEKYGLKSNEITNEKYVVVENNNLKEVATKLGITNMSHIPDKIESITYNKEKIDTNKIEEIKEKYIKVINNQISNNNFTSEKNVNLSIGEENILATKYSLNITELELYNIIYNLLDNLKDDKETLQLYIDIFENESLTVEALQENITNTISDFESQKDNYVETNNITINVYTNKGKTIKTEILDNSENGLSFSCKTKSKKDELEIQIIKGKDESNYVGYVTKINLKNETSKNNINLSFNLDLNYNNDDIKSIESNMDSTTGISSVYEDKSIKVNFIISEISNEYAKITSDGEYNGTSLFVLEGELKKGEEHQIDDITTENSVIINSCSDEEFNNTVSPIKTKASDVILQKAEMVVPGISLLINSFTSTTAMESPIYMVDSDSGEISGIIVELNNALFECFNAYVKAYNSNSNTNISAYINEKNIKDYCPNAKEITFTDTGIRYTTNEGKVYEGVVDTEIEDGTITITDVKEVQK